MAAGAAEVVVRLPRSRRRSQHMVTLTVDPETHELDERGRLLTHAFVQVARGRALRRVLDYDLIGGRVRFIVRGDARPTLTEGVAAKVQPLRH